MSITKLSLLIAVAATIAVPSFAEQYYIVTITDLVGNKTFSVKTKEEAGEIGKKIAAEAKLFPTVCAEQKKEWDAAEEEEHQFRWQGNKLKPRQCKIRGPYTDIEKANEKADKMTDKELGLDGDGVKKTRRLSEREKEKAYEESLKERELTKLAETIQGVIDERLSKENGDD